MEVNEPVGNVLASVGEEYFGKIKDRARQHSVETSNVYNLVVDLPAEDIKNARGLHRSTFKRDYLQSAQYTSCLASSERLFPLIAETPGTPGTGDYKQFAEAVAAVAGGLMAIHAKVGSGQHGFIIVVQRANAEILQSFAGESGARLIDSFSGKEKRQFSVNALVELLKRMDDESAQLELFGGTVELAALSWSVAKLRSPEDIRERFGEQVLLGLNALK